MWGYIWDHLATGASAQFSHLFIKWSIMQRAHKKKAKKSAMTANKFLGSVQGVGFNLCRPKWFGTWLPERVNLSLCNSATIAINGGIWAGNPFGLMGWMLLASLFYERPSMVCVCCNKFIYCEILLFMQKFRSGMMKFRFEPKFEPSSPHSQTCFFLVFPLS